MRSKDIVIIGAGAAGLICAAQAGARGKSVLVIDHANKPGKKILMSGGGRCNFTNLYVEPDCFLSSNPHFCKSALKGYDQWAFIAQVDQYQIPWHEKEEGQLFCDNSSKDILDMLLADITKVNATVEVLTQLKSVEKQTIGFKLGLEKIDKKKNVISTEVIQCQSLVIATGGPSIPTLGATGFGFQLAEQFGHKVHTYRASLVPFTWNNEDKPWFSELSGISLPITVTAKSGKQFTNQLLFTHRGISGPAILQVSNYWQPGESVKINLCPSVDVLVELKRHQQTDGKIQLKTVLNQWLPKRLTDKLMERYFTNKKLAELNSNEMSLIANQLNHWHFIPGGTEGYRTAEVTLGGVDTNDISSKTMESKLVAGLYFIGEVLDVTGHLGGFNFQWAWASGYAAGKYV
ncbi:NAD(P)/FAD-dependent oxidoreductase [Endozoicomonas sp. SM1973]|uniref:NAD(P)/FAD-dependent oxidoreductase n=1 Tax=Spartinivicinus marinus TaxID=2994442 RepID=A0A853IG91_9GAMM|nr:NAD(P)/FAD-dependent oxidoreductase [Spartinivicinus marinus]MCX4026073.1 NAD(P)/FAD-dependent oxidoreductase [Spartinivicinus marinus]NYZ66556.1 NAD(P)/FAD-dependent oxidoreductase [Spartinivicinus marinus]